MDGGDAVKCAGCGQRWVVDCRQRWLGISEFAVRAAHARVLEHFGNRPGDGRPVLLRTVGGIERLEGRLWAGENCPCARSVSA